MKPSRALEHMTNAALIALILIAYGLAGAIDAADEVDAAPAPVATTTEVGK